MTHIDISQSARSYFLEAREGMTPPPHHLAVVGAAAHDLGGVSHQAHAPPPLPQGEVGHHPRVPGETSEHPHRLVAPSDYHVEHFLEK